MTIQFLSFGSEQQEALNDEVQLHIQYSYHVFLKTNSKILANSFLVLAF